MSGLLEVGDPAPWFMAATPTNPSYYFNTAAGRHVLLGFPPSDPGRRDLASRAFLAHRARFDDHNLAAFLVAGDPETMARARNQLPGLRWFLDPDRAVARLFGAWDDVSGEHPHWLLLDPSLRVIARASMDDSETMFRIIAGLPPDADEAGGMTAPVLIVPRVLDRDTCRRLIEVYEAQGGQPSGVMRDVDGRTVGILNERKSRRDATIDDEGLRADLRRQLVAHLLPEIRKAYQFNVTRMERYIVACYDSAEGGFFRPHRDNETLATLHRRFACSINLNAEDFEGGDLRFPEFGKRTYRPPTGGAVIFACGLQHEATEVTRGRRYAFLPFFYDDEGARIRQQNQGFLQASDPTPS